jgi:hypothetical protein
MSDKFFAQNVGMQKEHKSLRYQGLDVLTPALAKR